MPRTFADDLASDVANTFISDFAESIEWWPLGVEANSVDVSVVIEREGSPEPFESNHGERLIYRAKLHIATTSAINFRERHSAADKFLIDSKLWSVERPGTSDSAKQIIHVIRHEPITTKQTRIR